MSTDAIEASVNCVLPRTLLVLKELINCVLSVSLTLGQFNQ